MPHIAVLHDPHALPEALARPVVAIGNFDGLHRGHRAVIDMTLALAHRLGRPSAVLTFEPHPRDFFRPGSPVFRLTPLIEKTIIAERLGLDALIALSFDAGMAGMEASAFIEEWLVRRLRIAAVIVGTDFRFGAKRTGTSQMLASEGARLSFEVEILPEVAMEGGRVSSSAVRQALEAGDIAQASEFLGHRWFVAGEVLHGEKRGRELGFPTANLRLDAACRLRHGIYAVRVLIEGRVHEAVASFGRRPTFDNGAPLLEVFVFDFEGNLYGRSLTVEFVAWLRGEEKFASVEALVAQMHEDVLEARRCLREASPGADASIFEAQIA
ncbi:riboflavin kinase / FMN adenylyltransferase [Rhizobiales bacterium GAS191]|nr:riboflavin kinase / FMN adenylyltransferase [Rhizobiales bacterium GAS191]